MTFEPDPSLERLRLDHRSERAPARLRQRLLERLNGAEASPSEPLPPAARGPARWHLPSLRPMSLGVGGAVLAGGVLLAAVLLRLPASERELTSLDAVGPEPTPDISRAISGEPAPRPAPSDAVPSKPAPSRPTPPARPCPLDELLGMLPLDTFTDTPPMPPGSMPPGASWFKLNIQTPTCGPLPRHFVQLVPPGTPPVYRGPVVIQIPDRESPVAFAAETRWYFDALARERKAVAVYTQAMAELRPSTPGVFLGRWQTDGAHPEVDDFNYLDQIVLDLTRRGIIGGGNEVWLVGKGSGAVLALAAAASHPERYAGVAAFNPTRVDALPGGGLPGPRMGRRLTRVLFMVDGGPEDVLGSELETRSKEWALALGVPAQHAPRSPRVVLSPRGEGVGQFDIGTSASGAPGVRILTLARGVDPFPPPGAADALSLAASRRRPGFIDGAEEAWRYLGGESSTPPAPSTP